MASKTEAIGDFDPADRTLDEMEPAPQAGRP
jgi:hypothetical protein